MSELLATETTPLADSRRRNASLRGDLDGSRPVAVCRVCGDSYVKYRPWQNYCSPKCRKAAWLDSKKTEVPSDLRATLNRIESKLDKIIELNGGTK
jgi:hypothetical protein